MIRIAAFALIAVTVSAPAAAQPAMGSERALAQLVRQDASLREQIARLRLDQLVAEVDQSFGRHAAARRAVASDAATARDLDLYAF